MTLYGSKPQMFILLGFVLVVVTAKTNPNIKEAKVQEVHSSNPTEVIIPPMTLQLGPPQI